MARVSLAFLLTAIVVASAQAQTDASLNLPTVTSATMYFKNEMEGDTQALTPAKVTEIRNKNWLVLNLLVTNMWNPYTDE